MGVIISDTPAPQGGRTRAGGQRATGNGQRKGMVDLDLWHD